jgi:nucleotide-binding universal stress UspA family protein
MSKRLLVPVDGVDDADEAIRALPQVCEPGDEIVLLAVAEEPDKELSGSRPLSAIPEPYTGPAGGPGPLVPNDIPTFVSTEEIKEVQTRELYEALHIRGVQLKDKGFGVNVHVIFSDHPAKAILDYARDIDPAQIYMTRRGHERLYEDDLEEFASVLPATAA